MDEKITVVRDGVKLELRDQFGDIIRFDGNPEAPFDYVKASLETVDVRDGHNVAMWLDETQLAAMVRWGADLLSRLRAEAVDTPEAVLDRTYADLERTARAQAGDWLVAGDAQRAVEFLEVARRANAEMRA